MADTKQDIETLSIDKGFPVPKVRNRMTPSGATADRMEPGDSIKFSEKKDAISLVNALRYRHYPYTMRMNDDGKSWRVWRL